MPTSSSKPLMTAPLSLWEEHGMHAQGCPSPAPRPHPAQPHPHLKTRSCASMAVPCREPLRMPPLPTTAQRTQRPGTPSLSKRRLLAEVLRSRRVLPTTGTEQDGAGQWEKVRIKPVSIHALQCETQAWVSRCKGTSGAALK